MTSMRRLSSRIARGIGWAWIYVGGAVVLIGYAATVYFRGFGALLEMLNPYGGHAISNMIAVAITLAPGFVLIQLAEAIEGGQRKRTVVTLLLFPIAAALTVGVVWIAILRPSTKANDETSKVNSVEALDGVIKCLWARDRLITRITGPCDDYTPPQQVRVGETFRANGKTKTINVIFADRAEKDMPSVGLKAGDVICTAAESSADIPVISGKSEHTGTWLYVPKCKLIERSP